MNIERLNQLADFLDALPPEKFNFQWLVTDPATRQCLMSTPATTPAGPPCGTVCCAIGWTPTIWPEDCKWTWKSQEAWRAWSDRKGEVAWVEILGADWERGARGFFELTRRQVQAMFLPWDQTDIFTDADEDEYEDGLPLLAREHPRGWLPETATAKQVAQNIRFHIANPLHIEQFLGEA